MAKRGWVEIIDAGPASPGAAAQARSALAARAAKGLKREWGPALLPAPTVHGRNASAEAWRPAGDRVPAEAFRPRSVPFRVPFRSRSFFQVPRATHRSKLRWNPFRVADRANSGGFPRARSRTEARRLPLSGSRRSELLKVPIRTVCEANFADAPFADPSPEGPGSAGRLFGKWGRHRSEDLYLTLLPWGARPELSRHSRRSVASAFGRFRKLVSPFPEEPPCRLPNRYAVANRFARVQSACG